MVSIMQYHSNTNIDGERLSRIVELAPRANETFSATTIECPYKDGDGSATSHKRFDIIAESLPQATA
jgi:late competence protein required for DNA uptake (superfamily II DNA/RNA helicase)